MVAKKGRNKGVRISEDTEDDEPTTKLQAIVLADCFGTKFRPITLERPKVLIPLVNVPMIEYTLAWLQSAGIEEVFVFCCAHSKQVTSYLNDSIWLKQPNFSVKTIESQNSVSAGDVLRLIHDRNVIPENGDFVLVSGDTISNMPLGVALQEHKERRKKDANAVMTMVVNQSKPSPVTRQFRLGTDELIMAIDSDTKQLIYYEEQADHCNGTMIKSLPADHPSISLHNDKQDCYIDICSHKVLSLFTEHFDYQHLRRDFVKGLLDDIMGYKIFTHEIHSSYAARIDNFRSYDAVSKDIIQRWTYPLVPDIQFSSNCAIRHERQAVYRGSDIVQSRSAHIGPFTAIGDGITIGDNTVISNSTVGEGCIIGSNVSIEGCYLWHNVTIEDGCKLNHAIVCDGVIIKAGAVLEPGAVLSFKVIVGPNVIVPAYSKVSLLQQPIAQDSDEEREYGDNSSGILEIPSSINTPDKVNGDLTNDLPETQCWDASDVSFKVGNGGVGFIWSISERGREEEWRHSVVPIPADKLLELSRAIDNQDTSTQDGNSHDDDADDNDEDDDDRDDSLYFEKEVIDTFLRAVDENVKEDIVILEVNSLRLSYYKTSEDCASALFYGMMKLALDNSHKSASGLVKNTEEVIMKWKTLLKYYLPSIDEEIEVILKFEEMCSESAKEFSPLFVQILELLYWKDVIQEEAILKWAKEKEGADESDREYVKQSEKLIQWLNEASEEED